MDWVWLIVAVAAVWLIFRNLGPGQAVAAAGPDELNQLAAPNPIPPVFVDATPTQAPYDMQDAQNDTGGDPMTARGQVNGMAGTFFFDNSGKPPIFIEDPIAPARPNGGG